MGQVPGNDEADFRQAFGELFPAAFRVAWRIVGNVTAAEDCAAEALARAFQRWPKVRGLTYRDAWVMRVAANIAIDTVRKKTPVIPRVPSPVGSLPGMTTTQPKIDLVATASFNNGQPHAQFAWLREHDPVHWHPKGNFWAITRHADVRNIGRDHQTFSNWAGGIHIDDMRPEGLDAARNMMLYMDPPAHHRYRKLVRDPFSPRASLLYRARIEELATKIVDAVAERGECDLVEDIAGELPSYVIADLLGIPLDDGRRLYVLTEKMHATDDAVPQAERATAAMEMLMYAAQVRNEKLANPSDDIASELVNATVDGEELTPEQFNFFFLLLINAGGDTTRNAVGGGMLALFEHPDQRVRALNDLPKAVDEILRWVSPVVYMRRTAVRDTVIGDTKISAGDKLALYYGSANRDEAVFDHADRFDVGRDPNDHIAFGAGPHFCLGANVARIEIEVMLRELLTRLPDIEPAGDATWLESNFISGPKHLPVRFTPAR